jgi:two-component system chemotaxis response regulator CheY
MADLRTPILVVDDEAHTRRAMSMMLKKIGFIDITEDDGAATQYTMRQRRYGLVLSDLKMLPMSGLELLKLVRGEPGLASTPFIMVTGLAETQLVKSALALGVDGYIVKPFNSITLQQKIFTVLERVASRGDERAADASED